MYEQFFGLRERPFDLTPNPRYLVLTESHREVLQNLEDGIGTRKDMTLLVGEAGSGKSTMIRAAIERLPVRVHCVYLHNPTLTPSEFVEMLAAHFGLSEAAARSKTTLLLELERLFLERRNRGETTALVVDEAQSLPLELFEEIRLLASIEANSENLMTVIIAGQPELADRLNSVDLREFKQRIGLRCELRPLSAMETAAYVAGRIRAAGGAAGQLFTREAVALIHGQSQGFPRLINVIADNALLGGFAAGKHPVGSDIVRETCSEFDIQAASAHSSRRAGSPGPVERRSAAPASPELNNGSLFGASAATPKRLSSFWSYGEGMGRVDQAMRRARQSGVVTEFEPIPISDQDMAVLAAELPDDVVQKPAAADAPKIDALSHDDDREIKEIFFNTYFEKVWCGPQSG